jgi:hypothetical protein
MRCFKLLGIAALVVAIAIGLAGCPTDGGSNSSNSSNGDDNTITITITMTKLSATSFSLTLDKAEWYPTGLYTKEPDEADVNMILAVLDMGPSYSTGVITVPYRGCFEIVLSNDKKTVTATLENGFEESLPGRTFKFVSNPTLGQTAGQITGELIPDAGGDASYVGIPEEGIAF